MPVGNRPVIDRTIEILKRHGVNRIIVNAHHHYQQIKRHLGDKIALGIDIEVRVEPKIMGTGGGVGNTADFWDADPFILINGDILTDIRLDKVYEAHLKSRCLATLVLHDYRPFSRVQVDNRLNITDIAKNTLPKRLAFTGIHIIEPELLNYIPEGACSDIMDCYRGLIKSGRSVKAYVSKGHYWRDMGTIDSYMLANKEVLHEDQFLLAPGCRVHSSARLKDWAVIGENTYIGAETEVRGSILWENIRVERGKKVINSIISSLREVRFAPF